MEKNLSWGENFKMVYPHMNINPSDLTSVSMAIRILQSFPQTKEVKQDIKVLTRILKQLKGEKSFLDKILEIKK